MKVSIIIPVYKQADTLGEAIKSALNQTVPCEIIVINDGSPDNAEEVARKYPIKVINQVNKGLASARNTGIMNATGDYLLPLDSDDILKLNCVERILQVAQETNADVIAPSIQTFGKGYQVTTLMPEPKLEDFKIGNRIAYCSAIKREVLLEVGGYSPRMEKGWEDYHLWFNLLIRGKRIVTIPEPLVLYRTKESSMWLDAEKHKDELWAQIYKDFPHLK